MSQTIAAVSTAAAPGGIGIVRISGDNARIVADSIFKSKSKKLVKDAEGYTALYGHVYDDKDIVDEAIALVFAAPKSYTGEDVVEISCHGGTVVTRSVLRLAISAGARLAEAGEFTKRAFLNGKIDLTKAEAVMDIISAKSIQAARAAASAHDGALSKELNEIKDDILNCAAWLGAWADFPEEDIPEVENDKLLIRVKKSRERIKKLIKGFDSGRIIRNGIDTVIAGRTNAGKSTLMNLLSGHESSIVTEIEGTTRDVVTEDVCLGDLRLKISDTAGIRETDDPVEKFGIERAQNRVQNAELILAVFDGSKELSDEDEKLICLCKNHNVIAVINKNDLPQKIDKERIKSQINKTVSISAIDRNSLSKLTKAVSDLFDVANFDPSTGMLSNERQLECAQRTLSSLNECIQAIESGITLDAVSVCLEDCLSAIMELTGEKVTDSVANGVFHNFCVGK